MTDHIKATTKAPELPAEVLVELLTKATAKSRGVHHFELVNIARLAYAAGVEACCDWLREEEFRGAANSLRSALRLKPPSEKEQALAYVTKMQASGRIDQNPAAMATIIRAIESLPDPQ
jgi:hypothetical protein